MARFGYYTKAGLAPAEVFEGDSMVQDGEYVKIWRNISSFNEELVVALRLDKGQYVKKEG
jgi:hypothetical protein